MNDSARINERILRKEHTRDYLAKIESSSKKVAATFLSAEIKRLSLRHFDSLQLNTHFISRIARTRLEHAIIEKIEDELTKLLERTKAELDAEIDRAEILLKEHGITNVTTTYDVEPLSIVLKVISNWGRLYYEVLQKADQLMPILECFLVEGIISERDMDLSKAMIKRRIKSVVFFARGSANRLRRLMNVPPAEPSAARSDSGGGGPSDAGNSEHETGASTHGPQRPDSTPPQGQEVLSGVPAATSLGIA